MEVNGKFYPFWGQFVEKKNEFIGGVMEDFGDSIDQSLGIVDESMKTEITNIVLEKNGDDSAMFKVCGKDFDCGFDVRHGGITSGEEGWLTFSGYMGHTWRIKPKE